MLDDPSYLLADKRADDFGGKSIVVSPREAVRDVMEKRANDPVRVCTVSESARCRPKSVLKPRYLAPLKRIFAVTF